MFDLGLAEIALITVIAVLVLKPEDVPVMMRTLAKAFQKIRTFSKNIQTSIDVKLYEMEAKDKAIQIEPERKEGDEK